MITPPPTETPWPSPTEDPCFNIWPGGFWFGSKEVGTEIWNNNPTSIKINWIHFYWPVPNGKLEKIRLGGDTIWNDGALPPEVWATSLMNNRTIPPFASKRLIFEFQNDTDPFGYFVEIYFDNGCYFSDGI
jgi:hypothetical protein